MKLLSIRIPMAVPGAIVPQEDELSVKRAAFAELCVLVPGLASLKNSIGRVGTQAFGNQLCLTITLVPTSQLTLKLSTDHWNIGRVVELDHTIVDQIVIKKSIQLTLDLLADASVGIPSALAEWHERFKHQEQRRTAGRLRRDLRRRYELSVFDQAEVMSLPELEATQLKNELCRISLVVKRMNGKKAFWADHLQEIRDDGHPPMTIDPREIWMFLRRGASLAYEAGTQIHRSMEKVQRIDVVGRIVIHVVTCAPVAMEVEHVINIER